MQQEIGLTKIVPVISNGAAIAGTVKEQLSKEAEKTVRQCRCDHSQRHGQF